MRLQLHRHGTLLPQLPLLTLDPQGMLGEERGEGWGQQLQQVPELQVPIRGKGQKTLEVSDNPVWEGGGALGFKGFVQFGFARA